MKQIYFASILLFLVFFISINRINALVDELPLLNKIIYIDPGHGGTDPGTLYRDIYEKDINLEISKLVRDELLKKGAVVYMTREGDYDLSFPYAYERKRSDLSNRIKLIEKTNSDMYLSIHLNSIDSSTWSGAQVFYNDINKENKIFAEIMQNSFAKNLNSKRDIKEVNDLYMYKSTKTLGLLLEVGFLSNPNERYLLRQENYQKKIALSITKGVIDYYEKKS